MTALAKVAEDLGESEKLLHDLTEQMDTEDGAGFTVSKRKPYWLYASATCSPSIGGITGSPTTALTGCLRLTLTPSLVRTQGAAVLNALVDRAGIDPAVIEDVILGCVTQGGEQSFAFGRNVVLASELAPSVPAVTIDRQRGPRFFNGIMPPISHRAVACDVQDRASPGRSSLIEQAPAARQTA